MENQDNNTNISINEENVENQSDNTNESKEENTNSDIENAINNEKKSSKVIRIIKRVCFGIVVAILSLLIIIFGWLTIDKYALKSRAPSIFGYSSFVVTTGSMTGTIDPGDMIVVKDTGNYKIGDIITFFPDGATIPTTHRIIGTSGDRFITKGDFNNTTDREPVEKEMIVGEVVNILPKVGIFVDWVKHGGGIFYIVSFVAILGLGAYVIKKE